MLRTLMLCAAASVAIGLAHPTFAQGQFGTAAEAKAMLEKAVAAVKADKTKALDALKGKNIREIKDKNGKALGEEMMTVAKEGKVDEVSYMWPRPGADTTPVQKVSYVTKAGDQVCGVGYYK